MEDARPSKLRRLEDLRRSNPYVSSSALSSIVKDIHNHGLPELHQPKHMKQARDSRLAECRAYGPVIDSAPIMHKDGTERKLLLINMFSLMQGLFEQDGAFTALVKTSLHKFPSTHSTPWSLIYYCDEVVPGNPLSADTSRKVQTAYLSFKEFGPIALSKEEAWLVALIARSSQIMEMEAGMSQATAVVLNYIFHHPACSPDVGGLMLKDGSGNTVKLWFKLGIMLQDGAAHKVVWGLRGDAASKFCVFCQNLLTKKSNIVDESNEHILVAESWNLAKIKQATNADVIDTAKRLQEKSVELSAQEFVLWQQAVGMTYNQYSLLNTQPLQHLLEPISQFLHDWMHCFLVSGIFCTVMHLVMSALEGAFATDVYQVIANILSKWHLPAVRHDNLGKLFEPKRKKANKLANTFKCTASEALGLCPIFAYFLQTFVISKGLCEHECTAYLALADIVEMLQLVPLGIITPTLLGTTIQSFIDLCIKAEWQPYMHTKFHWCLHFQQHLSKHNMLPSCFVQERKHKVIKRCLAMSLHEAFSFVTLFTLDSVMFVSFNCDHSPGYASSIQNLRTYELSVTSEIICHDMECLKDPTLFSERARLVKNSQPSKKLLAFLHTQLSIEDAVETYTCLQAYLAPAGVCCKGDACALKSKPLKICQVWLHVQIGNIVLSMVSMWDIVKIDDSSCCALCLKKDDATFIETASIATSLSFMHWKDSMYKVIIPFNFR